jgi:hypothetical protein
VTAYDPATDLLTIHICTTEADSRLFPTTASARSDDDVFTLSTPQYVNYFKYARIESGGRLDRNRNPIGCPKIPIWPILARFESDRCPI